MRRGSHGAPVRVLHVLGTSRPGGVESFVTGVTRHLDRTRFEMHAIVSDVEGPVAEELRTLGCGVQLLGGPIRGVRQYARYLAAVRRVKPAILHAHLGGRAVRSLARAAGVRGIVQHVHGPADEWVPLMRTDPSRLRGAVERSVSGADSVLTCSEATARMLRAAYPGIADRLSVVHYGVEPITEMATDVGGEPPGRPIVVAFIGRLVPQKGIADLARIAERVMARRSDVELVVAGDGPLRGLLKDCERTGRLQVLGELPNARTVLRDADILVVPSAWEAFGIVNLEAMAAGVPVAAYAVDGVPEVVVDGKTGLLVAPGDYAALTDAVVRLAEDPELRRRLGAAGRSRAATEFDERRMVTVVEQAYERVLLL